jgi:Dolichyl-phosphate-mannose-protein mannosyltransferase
MLKRGDFDPRHPGYPGLHFYLQRVSLSTLAPGETPEPEIYLRARRMTLVAGVVTALFVFLCGLRFLSPWGAGLAAAVTALSPLAFRESAVVNPDLMLGLFVALALLTALRLQESATASRFLAAGAAVGLAAAVKYTGVLSVVPYTLAGLLACEPKRSRVWLLAGLAAALAAFALASPYTFVDLADTLRGLGMHVDYYSASRQNAALEVMASLAWRGVGIVGAFLAALGAVEALRAREPKRLLVLGYPAIYLLLFAFFDRAFPRHALPLLPAAALLAASGVERFPGKLRWALALAVLAAPLAGSLDLWRRSGRPSPADRALEWTASAIPEGSRVLQDQWTPRLDPASFQVHRLQVEERVFSGNFDWVFYSGYPPGIDVSGLREVQRFATGDALGAAISVHQVPERAVLMGTTLREGMSSVEIGAGEPSYFGEGFDPPTPGAHGTERLSRGASSEIFFVLPEATRSDLGIELSLAAAAGPVEVDVEVNGRPTGAVSVRGAEPETTAVTAAAELTREGLNRVVLRYSETARISRRNREGAVRFYRMRLTRRY